MKQYLLTVYQPDGEPPPPPVMEKLMENVKAFHQELRPPGPGSSPGASTRPAPPPCCG